MAAHSAETRELVSRIGAHASWAATPDRTARTQAAREAFIIRFEKQVDPDEKLPAAERRERAEHARRAWLLSLSLKSKTARAARKAS